MLAGHGKRIANITTKPKCLLEINNKSLLSRNLHILRELKVKNITLVLGYKEKLIKREIINFKKYFNFNYAYNKNYKKLGNSYSLLIGLKKKLKAKQSYLMVIWFIQKNTRKIFILWTRNVFFNWKKLN